MQNFNSEGFIRTDQFSDLKMILLRKQRNVGTPSFHTYRKLAERLLALGNCLQGGCELPWNLIYVEISKDE